MRANIIDRSIASMLKVANHAGFLPEGVDGRVGCYQLLGSSYQKAEVKVTNITTPQIVLILLHCINSILRMFDLKSGRAVLIAAM